MVLKKVKNYFWRQISFFVVFSAVCLSLVSVTYTIGERVSDIGMDDEKDVFATSDERMTIVIDAGHGGLDGGAMTESGVLEKHLNLAVAKKIEKILSLANVDVVMTREEDVMLADESSKHKKQDDLNARLHTVDAYEKCVFVSIHMNKFPVEKYSGLQVYYSKNNDKSKILADAIQSKTVATLQSGNARMTKAADSAIYILNNIHVPAVLVECGFLSNTEEAALLQDEEYQDKLAAVISCAVLDVIASQTQ